MEQEAIEAVLVNQDRGSDFPPGTIPSCALANRQCPSIKAEIHSSPARLHWPTLLTLTLNALMSCTCPGTSLRTVALNEGSYSPEGINRFMVRRTIKSLLVGILSAISRVSAVNARGSSRCGMFSCVR